VATAVAVVVMSGVMLLFAIRSSLLVLVGVALLILGGRHFGNGRPGTGGHP